MIEKIKKTDIWNKLLSNPKFETEFGKFINNSSYDVDSDDLVFDLRNNKLIVYYTTRVKERDLDCQYKSFEQREFSLDKDNNLMINILDGRLESNYGYDFNNTLGGVINTYYSNVVYDTDGIELSYQSYSDKYHLDKNQFNIFKNDLREVILSAYNPNLSSLNKKNPYPNVIGRFGRFIRQNRSKENLGIVEVTKYTMTPNANISDLKEELYFNTFYSNNSDYTPELIHIMNGFPFANINNDTFNVNKDFAKLGLTSKNYQEVARDRFLKELNEGKQAVLNIQEALEKYNLMINRLEKERKIKERTR